MYAGVRDVVRGFSKNFFAAFDFRILKFAPVLLLFVGVFVLPYAALVVVPGCLPVLGVLLNLSFRLLLAGRMNHGLVSALLHPVGAAAAVLIGLNAVRLALLHRGVTWKGRRIPVRTSST
jgi:chlorobactene glucosyltransferase